MKSGRWRENTLKRLPRLDAQRDRKRIRRAITQDELAALLHHAGKHGRRAWYLTAALAGLRRAELGRLRWRDVDLDAGKLTISDGKAHRTDELSFHPQLAPDLARIKQETALPMARVFPTMVTNRTRQEDFAAAGIKTGVEGRVADWHALRVSLGATLARQGAAPQVAQRMMRHSDYWVTLKHYTVLGLEDTASAIRRVPAVPELAQPAQQLGCTGTDGGSAGNDCPQNRPQSARRSCRGRRTWRRRPAAARGLVPVPLPAPAPPGAQPARAAVTLGRNSSSAYSRWTCCVAAASAGARSSRPSGRLS